MPASSLSTISHSVRQFCSLSGLRATLDCTAQDGRPRPPPNLKSFHVRLNILWPPGVLSEASAAEWLQDDCSELCGALNFDCMSAAEKNNVTSIEIYRKRVIRCKTALKAGFKFVHTCDDGDDGANGADEEENGDGRYALVSKDPELFATWSRGRGWVSSSAEMSEDFEVFLQEAVRQNETRGVGESTTGGEPGSSVTVEEVLDDEEEDKHGGTDQSEDRD